MSLYEIMSLWQGLRKIDKNIPTSATPAEMAETRRRLMELTANDPSVRLK